MKARFPLAAAALALLVAACGKGVEGGGRPVSRVEGAAELPLLAPERSQAGSAGWEILIVPRTGWRTDFARHTVPLVQFTRGGPGRDGIPALDRPRFETVASAARWLEPRMPVIELELRGEARAYPLAILVWHEIVNDEVGGVPVAVTFCPLCNTALAFERRAGGMVVDFGTTGVLRFSDLVMYDRQTESWWQQFGGDALVGTLAGAELAPVPVRVVGWGDFAARHPAGLVLSRETGFERPYGSNPYAGYDDVDEPPFFGTPNQSDGRVPLKQRVVFLEHGGEALAVAFSELARAGSLEVELAGRRLELSFVPGALSPFGAADGGSPQTAGSATVRPLDGGEPVPFDTPFWFAVAAFRPDVRVIDSEGRVELPRRRPPPTAEPGEIAAATARLAG